MNHTSTPIHFQLTRETKGALLYTERGHDPKQPDRSLIGTVYLRKAQVARPWPLTITISITGIASPLDSALGIGD